MEEDEPMTRFESKRRLVRLLKECQLNRHESSFCAGVRDAKSVGGKLLLDLRLEGLKALGTKLQAIHDLYLADFPPPRIVPPSVNDVPASSDDTTVSPVKVKTTITSTEEYEKLKAGWRQKCNQEEDK